MNFYDELSFFFLPFLAVEGGWLPIFFQSDAMIFYQINLLEQ
jgi:hypothetical protein